MSDQALPAAGPPRRRAALDLLGRHGALLALALLLLFNLLVTPNFTTWQTLNVNLTQVCAIVIVAVGMTLVIATGGPSIPKLGATGFAYDLARRFGLKVVEPRPALVPLTLPPDEALFRELSGVATPVVARAGSRTSRSPGSAMVKVLPRPGVLSTSSCARWFCSTCLVMARPSPVPP